MKKEEYIVTKTLSNKYRENDLMKKTQDDKYYYNYTSVHYRKNSYQYIDKEIIENITEIFRKN